MPDDAAARKAQEAWGYSDAVVAGDMIYLSGVVISTRQDDHSIEASYERGFLQIEQILKRLGSSWRDVVDITSFHTDIIAQIEPMVAVKNRFVKAPFPAWTAVGVTRLIPDNGITEIKVIARRVGSPPGTPFES